MLAPITVRETDEELAISRLKDRLAKRLTLPQRHRLLHGYPLLAAMPRVVTLQPDTATAASNADAVFKPSSGRELLVGVLPHPYCNPKVRGCGFCTFPHENYRASKARAVVDAVIKEIELRHAAYPNLRSKLVHGLYLGGGTANLTPNDALKRLGRTLQSHFHLSEAEITLEGVPAYYLKRDRPMDILQGEINARHFRISMGIQTFDEEQLRRMGRSAFGSRKTIADVVTYAHSAGMTVSGDLLYNLPGQSVHEMKADLATAIELGLDQICLYHLVLFKGLGTAWSKDHALLNSIPSNEAASENWRALRYTLLSAGYRQTSLTNFERGDVYQSANRFIYESYSFRPNRFDMMGFGPSGISFHSNTAFTEGIKVANTESSPSYNEQIAKGRIPIERLYRYDEHHLRIFYLIRRLAGLSIVESDFIKQFGSGSFMRHSAQFKVLMNAGLIRRERGSYVPTPTGMFYADTVASVFTENIQAATRIRRRLRRTQCVDRQPETSNAAGYM